MKIYRLFYLLPIIILGMDHLNSLLLARIAWERANDIIRLIARFN